MAAGLQGSGARLRVDLGALQRNWRMMADLSAPARCGASVKADAYGLGAVPVTRALWQAGCRDFFVALPQEGADLRAALPEARIYILNGLMPGSAACCAAAGLIPALAQGEELVEYATLARRLGQRLAAAIHIDSGMNRLGFSEAGLRTIKVDDLAALDLVLVMSHLSHGDEPDHPANTAQARCFNALRALLPPAPASLANSPGVALGRSFLYDLTRPGISLYGGEAVPGAAPQSEPVVTLEAPVLQIRILTAGETVGYNGTWTAAAPARIAILAAGYRDGVRRTLQGHRVMTPAGPAEIVGRISMDLLAIDVTALPDGSLRRGDMVEIIGPSAPLAAAAARAGTVGYEILTGLGSRPARLYLGVDSTPPQRQGAAS